MKALRIIRNIVLALLGLELLLLVALQVILRPKVLTPIVNRFAEQYVEGGELFRHQGFSLLEFHAGQLRDRVSARTVRLV